MSVVLDASAAVAWMYREGIAEDLDQLYDEVQDSGALVPQIWHLEIANVLLMNHRKGRHDLVVVRQHLASLSLLHVQVDEETRFRAWDRALQMGARHGLTSYDAAYLELAARMRAPLATLDRDLIRAAKHEAVALFWG